MNEPISVKVVLLGESGVGKTSLINQFVSKKFNPKESFKEITFKEYTDDVIRIGTALTKKYNLKDERVVIIGENTYDWYVSYMAMLCGVGIAVPIDKELPANEI